MSAAPACGKLYLTLLALTLLAAFHGWMFDGMEMGIFPIVAGPALVRAAAQGLSYHRGRVLAGFGALQMGPLVKRLGGSYEHAGAAIVLLYFDGMIAIWFAPETCGQPLPA